VMAATKMLVERKYLVVTSGSRKTIKRYRIIANMLGTELKFGEDCQMFGALPDECREWSVSFLMVPRADTA
jgi:hypothetical protein